MNTRDLLDPDMVAAGKKYLAECGAVDAFGDIIISAAESLPEPFSEIPLRVHTVWLAGLMVDAAKLVRDQQAALGVSQGIPVADFAHAAGRANSSSGLRTMRFLEEFGKAQSSADLHGGGVLLNAYGFDVWLEPARG